MVGYNIPRNFLDTFKLTRLTVQELVSKCFPDFYNVLDNNELEFISEPSRDSNDSMNID